MAINLLEVCEDACTHGLYVSEVGSEGDDESILQRVAYIHYLKYHNRKDLIDVEYEAYHAGVSVLKKGESS